MKKSSLFFLLILIFNFGFAQNQNISGVVNIYTPVTQVNCNNVTVVSSVGFSVGDRVLLIQMQGATLDQTNTPAFGYVTNYNNCGNFEFATISSINSNTIVFQFKIFNSYTPSGNVQLIRVPTYTNATVNNILTCNPWNGSTGGVLVLEVSGTLTLANNINVSGKGFRGGTLCTNPDGSCGAGYSDYFYQVSSGFGAEKGEGISVKNSLMDGGRGAWSNGGGGGNKHNSGGGGGGNFSSGGLGGNEANFCPITQVGGVGGYELNYSFGKIFLGGGGGCSDNNNGVGTTGTNGGGIIIIKANSINGNSDSIISNGLNQTYIINNIGDGAGGGGAGGTILLKVNNYTSSVYIVANGGHGGDQMTTYPSCFGPGGGGGTGIVCFSNASLPVNTSFTTLPGASGIDINPSSSCYNTSYGAQSAQTSSGVLFNFNLPEGNQSFSINLGPDTNLCSSSTITLNAGIVNSTYLWSTGATTQTITVSTLGSYWVTVNQNGCIGSDTITVTNSGHVTLLPNDTIFCGASFTINPVVSLPYYNWSTGANTNTITVINSGVYTLSSSLNNCVVKDSIVVSFITLSGLNLGPDITSCDSFYTLSSNISGVNYLWSTGASSQQIIVTQSGMYSLLISNNQCFNNDTVIVNLLSNVYVKVPNIVTPNNDGINDNLALINLSTKNLADFDFVIYNEWGIKMFETNNTNFIWNNNKTLNEADDGTYFWIMQYTDDCTASKKLLKGFLTLLK